MTACRQQPKKGASEVLVTLRDETHQDWQNNLSRSVQKNDKKNDESISFLVRIEMYMIMPSESN